MMFKKNKIKPVYGVIRPSVIFLGVIFLVGLLPAALAYSTGYQENLRVTVSGEVYAEAVQWYFFNVILSVVMIVFGLFCSLRFKWQRYLNLYPGGYYNHTILEKKFVYAIGFASIAFVVFYLISNGFGKLHLLGSELEMVDFRLAGSFDDIARIHKSILQVSRRLLFPFALSWMLIFLWLYGRQPRFFYSFWVLFVLSVVITLDRAPLLMLALLPIFLLVVTRKSPVLYTVKILPFGLILVVLLGGGMTYLQHNVLDISLVEIINSGFYFLWHRVFAAPVIASVELVFIDFPSSYDFLFLKYSRLNALFGGGYVGTAYETSIFVTPVGYIADIYRNFGTLGVGFISLILGLILGVFEHSFQKMSYPIAGAFSFTIFSFAFYLTNGVFFSQGVFIQLFFLLGVSVVFGIKPIKWRR